MTDARAVQLRSNLAAVHARIAAACSAAGRCPEDVMLVAITKTWPASDVRHLAALGVRHVGENRDQEARLKAEECRDLGLTWHFVGQLQRNKAGSVVHYADIVESVDRPSLVTALDRAAERVGRRIGVCLQVDLSEDLPEVPAPGGGSEHPQRDGELEHPQRDGGPEHPQRDGGPEHAQPTGRGGARPDQLPELAAQVEARAHLELLGVMAVAPLGVDPRGPFARLAELHDRLLIDHPRARMRSAGMSADLEAAIAAGATHVRLGSALLGHREPLK